MSLWVSEFRHYWLLLLKTNAFSPIYYTATYTIHSNSIYRFWRPIPQCVLIIFALRRKQQQQEKRKERRRRRLRIRIRKRSGSNISSNNNDNGGGGNRRRKKNFLFWLVFTLFASIQSAIYRGRVGVFAYISCHFIGLYSFCNIWNVARYAREYSISTHTHTHAHTTLFIVCMSLHCCCCCCFECVCIS